MSQQAPLSMAAAGLRPDLVESFALPRASPPGFTDHIFKTAHGVELGIRVWPAANATYPAPFVTWHHGGAFIAGSHFAPLSWMEPGLRQRGYHMVTPAYRLGPQVTLDEQVQDGVDSIAWCREHLPRILGADKVNVDRYVICGESAGGTLVTLMGHRLDPPPKAIIEAYGIVDFLDKHFGVPGKGSEPGDLPSWEGEFTEEQLHAALRDRDPSHCLTDALFRDEQQRCSEDQLSELWATDFKYTDAIRLRAELHIYRSDRPFIAHAVERERFNSDGELFAWLGSVSAIRLLDGKTTYPPTAFLHGIDDTAVPMAQSQRMAATLREMGVPTVECYEHGPHVFDNVYKVRRGGRHR